MPFVSSVSSAKFGGFTQGESGLYSFTSHTFTNAGATGRDGPTIGQVQSAYSAQSWAQNTSFLDVSNGVQIWTVPIDGTYEFTVAGARGASGSPTTDEALYGGSGAILRGRVSLTKGTLVNIVVGQNGTTGGYLSGRGGGGGGGSFVYTGSIGGNGLILAAGGGGGGDDGATAGRTARSDLNPTITGGTVQTNNGQSGIGGYSDGAGWLEEGQNYPGTFDGQRWRGGQGNTLGLGGFGGGSGDIDDGGSGGGFTGGSGTSAAGGGSGGSFYAGMSNGFYSSSYTVSNYSWQGTNADHGYVQVSLV